MAKYKIKWNGSVKTGIYNNYKGILVIKSGSIVLDGRTINYTYWSTTTENIHPETGYFCELSSKIVKEKNNPIVEVTFANFPNKFPYRCNKRAFYRLGETKAIEKLFNMLTIRFYNADKISHSDTQPCLYVRYEDWIV